MDEERPSSPPEKEKGNGNCISMSQASSPVPSTHAPATTTEVPSLSSPPSHSPQNEKSSTQQPVPPPEKTILFARPKTTRKLKKKKKNLARVQAAPKATSTLLATPSRPAKSAGAAGGGSTRKRDMRSPEKPSYAKAAEGDSKSGTSIPPAKRADTNGPSVEEVALLMKDLCVTQSPAAHESDELLLLCQSANILVAMESPIFNGLNTSNVKRKRIRNLLPGSELIVDIHRLQRWGSQAWFNLFYPSRDIAGQAYKKMLSTNVDSNNIYFVMSRSIIGGHGGLPNEENLPRLLFNYVAATSGVNATTFVRNKVEGCFPGIRADLVMEPAVDMDFDENNVAKGLKDVCPVFRVWVTCRSTRQAMLAHKNLHNTLLFSPCAMVAINDLPPLKKQEVNARLPSLLSKCHNNWSRRKCPRCLTSLGPNHTCTCNKLTTRIEDHRPRSVLNPIVCKVIAKRLHADKRSVGSNFSDSVSASHS